jgi:ATP-dependent exoDNAse (exonuclease V) alpha subunit
MLERLDLAYALNAHMAQGLTSDRGIAVMDSRERNLANQQTFLVTITRLRDGLTLFVDNADKLEAAVERNPA